MNRWRFRAWRQFPSPATLLTIGAFLALGLILVWGIIGFIAAP